MHAIQVRRSCRPRSTCSLQTVHYDDFISYHDTSDDLLITPQEATHASRNLSTLSFQSSLDRELDALVQKCGMEKDYGSISQLHCYICELGLDSSAGPGNFLVVSLVESGDIHLAQQVFWKVICQCECAWNALITGYANSGELQTAFDLYQKMQKWTPFYASQTSLVSLLKACSMLKDTEKGQSIYDDIDENLLGEDVCVGSALINMFSKCGHLSKACEVFGRLGMQNVVFWNALIAGHVENRHVEKALSLYEQMHEKCISTDAVTLVCALKACCCIGDTNRGREVHAMIVKKGYLENDLFIGSTLVHVYAVCGSLVDAQVVFDKLPVRNEVSWNVLIAGYVEYGFNEEALRCFKQMQESIISQDAVTLIWILKACASQGDGTTAQEIHTECVQKGPLDSNVLLGSILVDTYAKCGWFPDCRSVFKSFPVRDVVLWNVLISGLAEGGFCEEAIGQLHQMVQEGVSPNSGTFLCSLKACASLRASEEGQELHTEITKRGWLEDVFLSSILVDLYFKCGLHSEAQSIFDKVPFQDIGLWNALVVGYAEQGFGEEALKYSKLMQLQGIAPDAISFSCSLKACSSMGAISEGYELHKQIILIGLQEVEVLGALIDLYVRCRLFVDAQNVFEQIPVKSVVSLNALVSGYIEHGHWQEALKQRQNKGICSDAVTYICSLKACGSMKAFYEGLGLHKEIIEKGFDSELVVGNALIDFYVKCCSFTEVQDMFQKLPSRDTISWTAVITGYAESGYGEYALHVCDQMLLNGVPWDAATLVSSLRACGNIQSITKGRELHSVVARIGAEDYVSSTLVAMYAKCSSMKEAQKVFDTLPFRDTVSWNALLWGYVEHSCSEVAVSSFEQMQHQGVAWDAQTLVYVLKACASLGAAAKGQYIHREILLKGFDEEFLSGNTLVDMYSKCGLLAATQEVFDKLVVRDLVSWNALIAGYGQRGEDARALLCFEKMRREGVVPDHVTLSSVINACSHGGVVDEGLMYFQAISSDSGVIPTIEHFTCIVDLLGRAGHMNKAVELIAKMPVHPGGMACKTALGACRKWGNLEPAQHIFEYAVGLDERDAGVYVSLCNIYADAAM